MLKTVIVAENPFEPSTWETFNVDDICQFVADKWKVWPQSARIYHNNVAESCDVTPSNDDDVTRLQHLDGIFYIVVYPNAVVAIAIIAVVAAIAAAYFFQQAPKVPDVSSRAHHSSSSSPNNELSDRSNKARVNARIPDIFGTVRSTPDLIAVPYRTFKNNIEVEHAYMCVGRGSYDISDVRDGSTLIADVAAASAEVYRPHTSPNTPGVVPQLQIGQPIGEHLRSTKRFEAVNGQVLRPPNSDVYATQATGQIRCLGPNQIELDPSSPVDLTSLFAAGDWIEITRGGFTHSGLSMSQRVRGVTNIQFLPDADPNRTQIQFCNVTYVSPDEFWTPVPIPGGGVIGMVPLQAIELVDSRIDGIWPPINLVGAYTIRGIAQGGTAVIVDMPFATVFDAVLNQPPAGEGDPPRVLIPRVKNTTTDVPYGTPPLNLDGKYFVLGVTAKSIVLSNPGGDWNLIGSGSYTRYGYPILDANGPRWIGPFTMDVDDMDSILANFVAPNGLYADNGTDVYPLNVDVAVEVTPIDQNGSPTGSPQTFNGTIVGSAGDRSQRALTLDLTINRDSTSQNVHGGPVKVRAHRTSQSVAFVGSVVDEVRWRDIYSSSPVAIQDFGDITTIQTITYATTGALVVKERKLNVLAARKIQRGTLASSNESVTLSTELSNTDQIDDILMSICLDPYIGRRQLAEVDLVNIYTTMAAVRAYFGTSRVTSFNYTFDQENVSFEESVASIVSDAFCTAYRRGSSIKLAFEKKTVDSVLLFNHRNKIPGTEIRTITFGNVGDFDGVELTYVDPFDDAVVTYYLPADKSATTPKKVESIGIRSVLQAHFHACRLWNKLRYQNTAVEFEATQEANILTPTDRLLVADNTRPETIDGEVIGQNGLELELSQDARYYDLGSTRYIFLQHIDGSVESIRLTGPGSTPNRVVLSSAPKLPLAVDSGNYAKATFTIVVESPPQSQTFLLSEKEPKSNFTVGVKAVNYDDRFYQNDLDFINGIVVDG